MFTRINIKNINHQINVVTKVNPTPSSLPERAIRTIEMKFVVGKANPTLGLPPPKSESPNNKEYIKESDVILL